MFDLCVLHIGTEKTGTTSIQHFLLNNASQLRSAGMLFPKSFGLPSQTGLAIYAGRTSSLGLLTSSIGTDKKTIDEYRESIRARFQHEVKEASDCHTLLLSSEHLHSRLSSMDDIYYLRDFLRSFAKRVKVIVYLRRQDRLAVSLASTYYKAGYAETWKLPKITGVLPHYYDYQRLIENYASAFGFENCVARLFELAMFPNGDLIEDYCKQAGVTFSADFKRQPEENQSLSLLGQRLLVELNRHIPRSSDTGQNPLRRNLVSIMSQRYKGRAKLLTRSQARAFYEQFKDSNSEIRNRFFPDLERPSLFDDDFSAYPEEIFDKQFTFEDACEAAAFLWVHQAERVNSLQERFRQQSSVNRKLKAEIKSLRAGPTTVTTASVS